MKISVVVSTYNRADTLRLTLDSLANVHVPAGLAWELLVVDNNSSDHTRQIVSEAGARLPCRYLFEGRQGKSFALNTAIREAHGDVLAFTDDDVTVDTEWLAAIWNAFTRHDCIGIGGRILPVWPGPKPRWYCDSGPYRLASAIVHYDHGDVTREAPSAPFGANMAFRKDVFAQCGLFRNDLGPNHATHMKLGEDTEFCRRVQAHGGRILYVAEAVVKHPVGMERLRKSYFQSWYYAYGRSEVRVKSLPAGRRWFRIPRYMFREIVREAWAWLACVEPRQRFFYKLACYRTLGQMVEARVAAQPDSATP